MIHPMADSQHPLMCLLGPSVVSLETAISGSYQQNVASVCNGVSVWRLIMGWMMTLELNRQKEYAKVVINQEVKNGFPPNGYLGKIFSER